MGSDTRILVLGASGMLGHKMLQKLGERFDGVAGLMHGQADSPRFRHVPFLRSARLV